MKGGHSVTVAIKQKYCLKPCGLMCTFAYYLCFGGEIVSPNRENLDWAGGRYGAADQGVWLSRLAIAEMTTCRCDDRKRALAIADLFG
jgi:hypothetical protein